jgi:hypothetical protein
MWGDYWFYVSFADTLANIGDELAIPDLHKALKSGKFYAIPAVFKALIALDDKEAIPLAIQRISPALKNKNSALIIEDMEEVTGVNFDYDRSRWEAWWQINKDSFELPANKNRLDL